MKPIILGALFLIGVSLAEDETETRFGKKSDALKVEVLDYDTESKILTLEITNTTEDQHTLLAFEQGPPPRLAAPNFWFIYRHPAPSVEWFPEDARKGTYIASKHNIVLRPKESSKFTFYLDGFRRHIDYWFHDVRNGLRYPITNRIEQGSAGQPEKRSESIDSPD